MPRRATATGLLGQRVVVVDPDGRLVEQVSSQATESRRQGDHPHQRVVQPHLLECGEPPGDLVAVLGVKQPVEALGHASHHSGREHAGQPHERIVGKRFDVLGTERVRLGELVRELLVARRRDVGEARPGSQLACSRTVVVLGESDVPVPPVLVVARPVLLDAALAVSFGEFVVDVRVQNHSSAASCLNT